MKATDNSYFFEILFHCSCPSQQIQAEYIY